MTELIENCIKCNKQFTHKKTLLLINGCCWRCRSPLKVAMKECEPDEYNYPCGPEGFTLNEVDFARAAGANIKTRYSKTMNESYYANVCKHCNAMIGQHYLFTDYYHLAMVGHYKYQVIYQGSMCFECEGIS